MKTSSDSHGLKADTREGGCNFMFYYVSLEQKQHLDFGGKQRAARACEQYKYHKGKNKKNTEDIN